MPAPDLFGILDGVKRLTAPAGLGAAHVDGFSWARAGSAYGDTTKLTADDWNRIVANLRMMVIGAGVDLDTLDPASPNLLTTVLDAYLATACALVLSGTDVGGYGMMAKAMYDPDANGIIGLAQGGTGVAAGSNAALRTALGIDNAIAAVHSHGADIASASTVNLDTATGDLVDVTGNTTITAVTLAEGRQRVVRFTGTPQITVGASLVGNGGGANITAQAGDMALFRGYAAGIVRFWLIRASGKPVVALGASDLGALTTGSGTPVLTFGGASTGITYSTQTMAWRQLGNGLYFVDTRIVLTSKGSASGAAAITGALPVNAAGSQPLGVLFSGMTSGVGDTQLYAFAANGGTGISLHKTSGGARVSMTDADFGGGANITVTGVYAT